MNGKALGLGIAGAGEFAAFIAAAVADLPSIRLAAITDADHGRATRLAAATGVTACRWEELPADPDIDAIVVATPPAGHWFWDPAASGGILVEHGVHFFDAAAVLMGGPARRIQAMGAIRPDGDATGATDLVVATVTANAGSASARARGHDRILPHHVSVLVGLGGAGAKRRVYAESVRAAVHDLAGRVRDGDRPVADVDSGWAAVATALAGTESLRTGTTVEITQLNAS